MSEATGRLPIERLSPVPALEQPELPPLEARGRELLARGKMGCLIAAGGVASRLGGETPKGLFPITPVCRKSFFQLFAERGKAASERAGVALPMAIMTSDSHLSTVEEHFGSADRFGLDKEQFDLFLQPNLPYLDEAGRPLLDGGGDPIRGPCGNGASLEAFCKAGLLDKWRKRGVDYLLYLLVDNALADPFDCALLGYHANQGVQITLKAVEREAEERTVGLFVLLDGSLRVMEYNEVDPSLFQAREERGALLHRYANISNFIIDLAVVEELDRQKKWGELPLHWVEKRQRIGSVEKVIRKGEYFIFDLLPFIDRKQLMVAKRCEAFAPLKRMEGPEGVAAVEQALLLSHRRQYEKVSGVKVADEWMIELDAAFYYPNEELLARWQGRKLVDSGFIAADRVGSP